MRNYKIKHSKRNIKKVFKHAFGEVNYIGAQHDMKRYHFRKLPVKLMRYFLLNYWHNS